MDIVNPATEEIIAQVEEDNDSSVRRKFDELKAEQSSWAAVPLQQRIECIVRFSALLEKNEDELALTLSREVGKPITQSHNEIRGARSRIRFFIDNAATWLDEEWITTDGSTREKIVYEPLGIVCNISAWNYPYLVGVNVFIPALIAGNGVFYKPSEYAILTGMHIRNLLLEAGVPSGIFQMVAGGPAAGELLFELPLDGYFFTGSYRTGRYIAQRVAAKLVPFQLELGGKDPLYVMDDVEDLKQVAAAALEGVVYNAGQSCCAVERIYVHESVYDRFTQEYLDGLRAIRMGDPLDRATELGPLSRPQQAGFLIDQIGDAVAKGARILAGGNRLPGRGYYMEPTVLVDVDHSMKIMREESFGPVVGIQKVKNDEEALQLMQDTEYGLTAAIYSKDRERAEKIMRQLDTGTVYWNCCDRVSATVPWSGRRNSGLGATLSYQGIRAFVQPKAYHLRG